MPGQFGKGRSKAIQAYRQFMEEGKEAERRKAEKEVSAVRARIAHLLCREMESAIAEAVRKLGVGTPAIAMAIKKKESQKKD